MSVVPFSFAERSGRYGVGLRVVEQYDFSRPYLPATDALGKTEKGERSRPLQTLIWYPAASGDAPRMTAGDYVRLWATERSFGRPGMTAHAGQRTAGMSGLLTQSLWAVRDAPEVAGRYPVVIYAPGHSNPSWENADLCEYLASHGHVVIASPSMGGDTRYPSLDVAGVEPQARDISFLIGYAQSLPHTDLSRVAVIGFSWGGLSNVFAASRDDRIRALVCLDGSIRFSPGLVWAGGVRPDRMTIPLLSIAQGQWSAEEKAQILAVNPGHDGPDVLNAWTHGDVIRVYMLGFGHADHISMSQRNEEDWRGSLEFYGDRKVDYGREDSYVGYGWLARYTLEFLNAYLKGDAEGMAFLRKTPVENGVPRRLISVSVRAAQPMPVSFESFRVELGRRGFDQASQVYAEFQQRDHGFALSEHTLSAWAEVLRDGGHGAESLAIHELNARLNPGSAGAAVRLGDAYRALGRDALAAEQYRAGVGGQPPWVAATAARKLAELEAR